MKIEGKKALNTNIIDSLTLDNDLISAKSNYSLESKDRKIHGIVNRIKKLSDEEKQEEVLNLFLNGDRIVLVEHSYNNKFMVACTESKRFLSIRCNYNSLIDKVILKYKNDLLRFLINNEFDVYNISTINDKDSYSTYKKANSKLLSLNISNLLEYSFINKILDCILNESEVIKLRLDGTFNSCYYIKGTNKRIMCDKICEKFIDAYISNYMEEINKNKKMQLKLEGF